MNRPLRPTRYLATFAALLLAGCGNSGSDDAPSLRVADQLNAMQSVLTAASENEPQGYTIQWSNFIGGPTVIAAQTGGSVDLGWMAETPLVFAQAAGSPVKVVAVAKGTRDDSSNVALVVGANSPIRTIADLRGKKVGYMPGTITQYLVVKVLDEAGLKPDDVTAVRATSLSTATLDGSLVDAFVTAEPQLTQGLASGKLRVLAYGGQPRTPGFNYLVASDEALADPKRAALIGEFVTTMARATKWQRENVEKAAPVTAKTYKVTPEVAEQILRRTPTRYTPIDASIIAAHQEEADLFHKLGVIRTRIDATKLFDDRYNHLVAQVESGT